MLSLLATVSLCALLGITLPFSRLPKVLIRSTARDLCQEGNIPRSVEQSILESELLWVVRHLADEDHDDLAIALAWAIALKSCDPVELSIAIVSSCGLDAQRPGFKVRSICGHILSKRFGECRTNF